MPNKSADHKRTSRLDRIAIKGMRFVEQPEKLFLLILVFGILTILGSIWFLRVNISSVFTVNQIIDEQEENRAQQAVDDFNELLAAQQKDTDRDGLTDYFEINIYKTSPYLPDSDSDGISDKDEIDQGTNPNCPEGKECGVIIPKETGTDLVEVIIPGSQVDFNYDIELGKEMRELLIKNGVDPEILEAVTDSELALLYQQVVAEKESGVTQGLTPENIDAATLRELLLNSGVDKEILDQLSDEQLMATYQETLQSDALKEQ